MNEEIFKTVLQAILIECEKGISSRSIDNIRDIVLFALKKLEEIQR